MGVSKAAKAVAQGKGGKAKKTKSRPDKVTPSKAKSAHGNIKEQKSKPASRPAKKRRIYTEKELDIPKLNMITPAGVQKPKGKKKGKVFVEDGESMMTILAMVTADKEGQIESKMIKARQMEEIRQARQRELEARQGQKKVRLEDVKDSLRRPKTNKEVESSSKSLGTTAPNIPKKRVSFLP